jgi:diacylglycerol kinase (ATP)
MASPESRYSVAARLRSIRYAFAGGRAMLATQPNARIHVAATILVLAGGLACRVSRADWTLLFLAIGLVWSAEAFNTALESLADEISQEHRQRIGLAKDIAAFAVLVSALTAIALGLAVFLPYLLS